MFNPLLNNRVPFTLYRAAATEEFPSRPLVGRGIRLVPLPPIMAVVAFPELQMLTLDMWIRPPFLRRT